MPDTSPAQGASAARGAAPLPLDVNTFIGGYPFRHVPHPDAATLVRVLQREGVARAWVGHLPSAFHRDPAAGNAELLEALAPYTQHLSPAPIVRPDWPGWRAALAALVAHAVPAIRAYPQLWGMSPGDPRLTELCATCAAAGVALVLTVRFEDVRQRHPFDATPDLSAAHVRELARAAGANGRDGGRVVVTAASRDLIEEVHWGLTPAERRAVFYDISWLWGPPSDELALLLRTVGADRLVYGTMWPLRLTQGARANLALLPADLSAVSLADLDASGGTSGKG